MTLQDDVYETFRKTLDQGDNADPADLDIDAALAELKSALEYGDFKAALGIVGLLTDYIDQATATVQAAAPLTSGSAAGQKSKQRGRELLPGSGIWLKG
jgi:hypothetical protein